MSTASGTYSYQRTFKLNPASFVIGFGSELSKNSVSGATPPVAWRWWIEVNDHTGATRRYGNDGSGDQTVKPADTAPTVDATAFPPYTLADGTAGDYVLYGVGHSGQVQFLFDELFELINNTDPTIGMSGNMYAVGYNISEPSSQTFTDDYTSLASSLQHTNTVNAGTLSDHFGLDLSSAGSNYVASDVLGTSGPYKVLLVQGNIGKVNNTLTQKRLGTLNATTKYHDGNNPVNAFQGGGSYPHLNMYGGSYGFTGNDIDNMGGGKFEMIKAYFPLNASIDATYMGNAVTGTGVPAATLKSGQAYSQPVTHQIPTDQTDLGGASWSEDEPA